MGEKRASTTDSRNKGFLESAPGFSGGTCPAPSGHPWPGLQLERLVGRRAPYHTPVFVLTSSPATFAQNGRGHGIPLVTEGIHAALDLVQRAMRHGRDVRLGGGVSIIRQYLSARLIDELHLAIRPVLLGTGEHLGRGIDTHALGYECAKFVAGERASHVILRKQP